MAAVQRACVLNRTLIDNKITNIRIGGRAPSAHLAEIEKALGAEAVRRILASHRLPSAPDGPLWRDDFDAFLRSREAALRAKIAEVTS